MMMDIHYLKLLALLAQKGVIVDEEMRKAGSHLSRPILIDICKDGTISYRTVEQRRLNDAALPVFSVNTIDEAQFIQVTFGRRQYHEHPDIPGQGWYRWTDFDGNVESLAICTARIQKWWERRQEQ